MPIKFILEKIKSIVFVHTFKVMCSLNKMFNKPEFDVTKFSQYTYEILDTLFESEKHLEVKCITAQGHLRNFLIKGIKLFAKRYHYSISTVHLAALFLDIYMDSYVLNNVQEHHKFVAIVVCMLAAKVNEIDDLVPSIKEILWIVNMENEVGLDIHRINEYEPEQIKIAYKQYARLYYSLEFLILESLKFSTLKPTIFSFIETFEYVSVSERDMNDIEEACMEFYQIDSMEVLQFCVHDFLKLMAEVVLNDKQFYNFLPSKTAAAMIAATRKLLGIKTFWNAELEYVTHCTIEEIEPIIYIFLEKQELMDEYASEMRKETEAELAKEIKDDSGYHDENQESECEEKSNELSVDSVDESEFCVRNKSQSAKNSDYDIIAKSFFKDDEIGHTQKKIRV